MNDDDLSLLTAYQRTRGRPELDSLLDRIDPVIRTLARREAGAEADEVAQRARCRLLRSIHTCQAQVPGALHRYLETVVRNVAHDLRRQSRRYHLDSDASGKAHERLARRVQDHPLAESPPTPEEAVTSAQRGAELQRAVETALAIEPARLPARHRRWARDHRVGATFAQRQRDVAIARAVIGDEVPVEAVAAAHGLTRAATRKAVERGKRALQLALRLTGETT